MFASGHSLLPSLYFFSFFLSPTATTSTPVASLGRVTKPVRTCSLIRKRGDSWTASRKNRRFRNRMPGKNSCPTFTYFRFFQTIEQKTVDFCGTRTQIVRQARWPLGHHCGPRWRTCYPAGLRWFRSPLTFLPAKVLIKEQSVLSYTHGTLGG